MKIAAINTPKGKVFGAVESDSFRGEERSFAAPADALADLAERTARTWSR